MLEGVKATVETEVALTICGRGHPELFFCKCDTDCIGGTHVTAFKAGLTKAVKQFASSKKLIKGEDDVRGDDALLGFNGCRENYHDQHAQFLSQTKESLTSPEVHGPVFSATMGI